MDKKILSMLSLCARAGKLCAGELACEKALQSGGARLVLIGEDASDNTKKKFTNKAFFYKVPVIVSGTREELSAAIGRNNRVTLVIMDESFARNIEKLVKDKATETETVAEKSEVGECLK